MHTWTAGTHSLTAVDVEADTITGAQTEIRVRPLAASQFFLLAPETIRPDEPFIFTVFALDRFGNIANDPDRLYTGTVRFTSSDAEAFLPFDTTFQPEDEGVRQFAAVLRTEGVLTLTLTDLDDDTITGTVIIRVGPGPGGSSAEAS